MSIKLVQLSSVFFRTLQVYFPILEKIKINLQRFYQSLFRKPFDKDFSALRFFPTVKGTTYLDVGGNNGFAIDAILMMSPHCKVHSFEPNPALAKNNLDRFQTHENVKIHNVGLGDVESSFKLYVPRYRSFEFSGLASLKLENAQNWLNNTNILFFNKKHLKIVEYDCEIKRLDDLALDPFFIKMDVQGFEYNVLLGAEKTIEKYRPIILAEAIRSDGDVMAFLKKYDYQIYRYENNEFRLNEPGSPNSFLMTEEKYKLLTETKSWIGIENN